MIVTAGLTPAWQQILRFDRVRPGEVNRAAEAHWCASGKGINVGMALAALGAEAVSLAPLGGWSGRGIADEFARRDLFGVWTECAAPTRVCTTLVEPGISTELVENAAPLSDAERAAFIAAYRAAVKDAAFAVLTGSLPPGTPPTFYHDRLAATPCPALLDVRGPELLAALERRPRVVKPNREELARTIDRPLRDAMRELIDRGAQAVVVTDGPASVWLMEGAMCWEVTPPTVEPVVNPIGCGDCLAAGLAWGLARGLPLIEAVSLGVAAAADNVTQLLPARLDPTRVAAWQAKVAVRQAA